MQPNLRRSSANVRDARTAVSGQLRVSLENRKDDARQPASQPVAEEVNPSRNLQPAMLLPSNAIIMISSIGDDFPEYNVDGNNSQGTWRSYFRSIFTRLCRTVQRNVNSADCTIEKIQQVLITCREGGLRNFWKLILLKERFHKAKVRKIFLVAFSVFPQNLCL